MPSMIIARNKGETKMLGQELIGKNECKQVILPVDAEMVNVAGSPRAIGSGEISTPLTLTG